MTLVPSFNKHQILKAEMLDALRDNPSNFINAFYGNFSDGILSGFDVMIDEQNDMFCIAPGMLKKNDKVYVLEEKTELKAKNGKNIVYLDIQEESVVNGTVYKFLIDNYDQEQDSMFELFRYYKSDSSHIKQPKDFNDIAVHSSNTIDYSYSNLSLKFGTTLRTEIFRTYALEILNKEASTSKDLLFAYLSLGESLSIAVIKDYFGLTDLCSNADLIVKMAERLKTCLKKDKTVPESAPAKKNAPNKVELYF